MIDRISTDLHTHTIVSGHAYSTLEENIRAAAAKNLEAICMTEHAPSMPGSVDSIYFFNLHVLPRVVDHVMILRGIELNILNYKGDVDLEESLLRRLDLVIASMHSNIIEPKTIEDHTRAWLRVIENPYIDCLGHPGRGDFAFDLPSVLHACKQHNKVIEVNNHTLNLQRNKIRCEDIILGCKAYGIPVMVNSDAHFSAAVGDHRNALRLLNELRFPEKLIVNRNLKTLLSWLKTRKPWIHDLYIPEHVTGNPVVRGDKIS